MNLILPTYIHAQEHVPALDFDHLSKDKTWQSLLHFDQNGFNIKDSKFLLSYENPSLKAELLATVSEFQAPILEHKEHAKCVFPARYEWLTSQNPEFDQSTPKPNCSEFTTFKQKVPAEKIKLMGTSNNPHPKPDLVK